MLGQHTAQDVSNLIKAADREVKGLGTGYTALNTAQQMPATWTRAWEKDYTALRSAYSDARRLAAAKVLAYRDMPGVSLDVVPAEREYAGIRKALGSAFREMRERLASVGIGSATFGGDAFGADPASFPANATVTTGTTGAGGRLLVRASPSSAGAQVGKFAHGANVTITGPSAGGYYPVSGVGEVTRGDTGPQGSLSGYSSTSFITPSPTEAFPGATAPTSSPIGTQATITTGDVGLAGRLKIRSGPSASSPQVGKFAHGQLVTITGPVVAGFFPLSGIGEISTGDATGPQGNLSGYGAAQFVTPQGVAPATPQPVATPVAIDLGKPAPIITPATPGTPAATPTSLATLPPKPPLAAATDAAQGRRRLAFFIGLLALLGIGGYAYARRRKAKKKAFSFSPSPSPVAALPAAPEPKKETAAA